MKIFGLLILPEKKYEEWKDNASKAMLSRTENFKCQRTLRCWKKILNDRETSMNAYAESCDVDKAKKMARKVRDTRAEIEVVERFLKEAGVSDA